jgi:glycosyltransferase involved in cell wall biosynthesis
MTPRRVAVVASEILGVAGTGGPGTADSFLAVALGRNGHDVELLVAPGRDVSRLSPEWESAYADSNVRVRPLPGHGAVRPQFLAPAAHVHNALRDEPPDVVVADDWRALPYASLRSRQLGRSLAQTAFILYCHGPARVFAAAAGKVPDTVARFGEEVAQRACVELADAVVSPSEWLVGWLRNHDWPLPESTRVVQNLWESVALGKPVRRAAENAPIRRLAFFGQLREGKGIRVFIESLRRLDPSLLEHVDLLFLGHSRRYAEGRIRAELGERVVDRLASLRLETGLERTAAIRELLVPGTLAVMPSLLENSPYAVAECIEHGVPFIGADVGGTPELVAQEDRARLLCAPSPDGVAEALERALTSETGIEPARPARAPDESLAAWVELIETIEAPRRATAPSASRVALVACGRDSTRRAEILAEHTHSVGVDLIAADSRRAGLERATSEWVLFLNDDDVPDEGLLDALVVAQAASGADAVTAAVRAADGAEGVQLFLGDPGPLGIMENQYGVIGLVRRTLATDDSDWLLFARLAVGGARVVSIPEPLSLHLGRPAAIGDPGGEGLSVLEVFEAGKPEAWREFPQFAATLGAALARREATPGPVALTRRSLGRGLVRRARTVSQRFTRPRVTSVADSTDIRPPLNVLHIGKTGGTALKHVLAENEGAARYQLLFRGHDVTLADVPAGECFMFLIRDPLTRFVSAFNGRLREDRPRYYYPWREEERVAFAIFKTPDQLAVALSSPDDAEREQAEQAMRGIGHVNTPYTFWFPDESAFRARLPDVFFIGLQDRLDEDFELLKRKLGLPSDARLPRDETVAHKTPQGFVDQLSERGRSNLERWYERDIAFVKLCRELAPRVNQT